MSFESSGLVTSGASTRGAGKDHAPSGPGRAGRTNRLIDPEQIADQDVGVERASPPLPSEDPDPEPDLRSPPDHHRSRRCRRSRLHRRCRPAQVSVRLSGGRRNRCGRRTLLCRPTRCGRRPVASTTDPAPGAAVIRPLAVAGPARLAGVSRATLLGGCRRTGPVLAARVRYRADASGTAVPGAVRPRSPVAGADGSAAAGPRPRVPLCRRPARSIPGALPAVVSAVRPASAPVVPTAAVTGLAAGAGRGRRCLRSGPRAVLCRPVLGR